MDLTLSTIEKCSVGELFKYAKELDMKAETTWELKQKLIVHIMKESGSVIELSGFTESVKQEKEETLKEDEKRRNKLEKYLDDIWAIYKTIKSFEKIKEPLTADNKVVDRDDPLISFINNELPNVEEDFEKMSEIVKKKPNCSLLICGDSGAGKSSFINLLMGHETLPTSIRSNSSCQVRLTYGDPERAEIVDNDSKVHIIDKVNFTNDLSTFLENITDREKVSCKKATIFLKSLILEGGLDIYDTIGLGETEMFNNELRKELNQITGIIFLLKKNNPIGDTTIGGLSEIIHQLALNGLPLGSMNFIINMCDLLPGPGEKENLRNNVREQLREKCTLINPEITTFSTKQELDFQKNKVMTTNYKDIIELIHQLHINSINTNTVKVFSFLIKFVRQTIDQISELEKYSASNAEQRKEYIFKLRNLECDRRLINQGFKKNNQKFLNDKKKECKKRIEDHFRRVETKTFVVEAVLNGQNVLYGSTLIDEINSMIEQMLRNEISQNFKRFIEKEHILKDCCDSMLKIFIKEFAEHQKQKDVINKEMNRRIDNVMNMMECEIKDIIALQSQNKSFLHLISPILVPIVKMKEYMTKSSWFSSISSIFNKANIQTFYKDTSTYVTGQSQRRYSSYFSRSSNVKNMIECLFKAPEQVTVDFEKYLSDDMEYLAKNITSLEEDMRKKERVFGTYKEIKEKLEAIYEDLCKFSLLHLQKEKKHIMLDKISFLNLSISEANEMGPIVKGRNRLVFRGQVQSNVEADSCVMVYKNRDGKSWRDLYDEHKHHNDISSIILNKEKRLEGEISKCFLEIRRHVLFFIEDINEVHPTFVVNGIDCSLWTYFDNKRKSLATETPDDQKSLYFAILDILKQILLGLKYLHSNSLVHYDLTGQSIGYSTNYQSVKLTSLSLPTKVMMKYEKSSTKYVLKRAHLPVAILDQASEKLYDEKSDMYCLGILLYSMWSGVHPFYDFIMREEIQTMTQFMNELKKRNHRSIIIPFERGFAHQISNWSTRCRDGNVSANELFDVVEKPGYYGSTGI